MIVQNKKKKYRNYKDRKTFEIDFTEKSSSNKTSRKEELEWQHHEIAIKEPGFLASFIEIFFITFLTLVAYNK